jgi:hypothetical protein
MSGARNVGAASLGMTSENFGYSRMRMRRVKKIQFGIVNPHELVRFDDSVCCALCNPRKMM